MAVLAIADLTFIYWETITLACLVYNFQNKPYFLYIEVLNLVRFQGYKQMFSGFKIPGSHFKSHDAQSERLVCSLPFLIVCGSE